MEVTDPCVKLGDILSMECANPTVLPKLKTIKLLRFHGVDKKTQNRVAVSILKVIECIHAEYPEIEVQNLGEQDFIITYEEQQSVGGVWHILKTSQVVLISFMGAAFSIMAFNNDVGVTKMFSQIYELVTGIYVQYRNCHWNSDIFQSFWKEEIFRRSNSDRSGNASV